MRRELREKCSKEVTEKIKAWCLSQAGLPRSAPGTPNRYALKYWKGLTVFLEDPRCPWITIQWNERCADLWSTARTTTDRNRSAAPKSLVFSTVSARPPDSVVSIRRPT